MEPKVTVLATAETKADEVAFLSACMAAHGLTCSVVDLSLRSVGTVLGGAAKADAMDRAALRAIDALAAEVASGACVVVGLGGGTGSEIILQVMRSLPAMYPKVLVTTLPFDPRGAVADNSIVIVPTLADLSGINATLRRVLENVAALTAGLCAARDLDVDDPRSCDVALTALGATQAAVTPLVDAIRAMGHESTVFHANGYGGAAFARFVEAGAFDAVVDVTPHELTRIAIAGAHTPMPSRFTAAATAGLPQIVLPGGLNFIGLGELALAPERFTSRPHYAHSGFFTHVKLTRDEMTEVATQLVTHLNAAPDRTHLVVPMGGFSHHDAPGGAIEDPALREVFLSTARAVADPDLSITVTDAHIGAPATTDIVRDLLRRIVPQRKEREHA